MNDQNGKETEVQIDTYKIILVNTRNKKCYIFFLLKAELFAFLQKTVL